MVDSTKLAVLTAEFARLRKLQSDAIVDATYLGWTREERTAFSKRGDRIEELLRQLAILDLDIP